MGLLPKMQHGWSEMVLKVIQVLFYGLQQVRGGRDSMRLFLGVLREPLGTSQARAASNAVPEEVGCV